MKLEPFELERNQSLWEHEVEINLTESGVSPVTLGELMDDPRARPDLFDLKLGYTQTNGTLQLRENISSDYKGTSPDNILATNGGAEANFVAAWYLLHESDDRDELVVLLPNYMQLYGVWKNLGGRVKPFHLKMTDRGWEPDITELEEAVTAKTAAVAICTPNNPTGAILDESQLKEIADITYDRNAWLLSDEIYRGAELDGPKAPSAFDFSQKVLVTSSLSKVYGLPGLRLGWIATSDPQTAEEIWAYTDYTSICPSALSDHLARIALSPEVKPRLEQRAKELVGAQWHIMKEWLDEHSDLIEAVPPKAAAMCFPRYDLDIKSLDLTEKLRKEKDVLVVPGAHFGMESFVRIGFGYDEKKLREGLRRLADLLLSLS